MDEDEIPRVMGCSCRRSAPCSGRCGRGVATRRHAGEDAPMGTPGGSDFTSRLAEMADVPALALVMDAAIAELQRAFLDDAQIASSRAIMGIDTQLIDDGTYFVVESNRLIAGCGGWS